ncbi:hypothetical protein [Vibrio metschnikovii]|uniref:Restriction endonuclease n=1 Tax=Vibrio metschnikovii TaxID=28172 RepID=A0A9X0UKS1_VIBME|nr:hypothetical protein [Vibrio metschnikovii]MBC5853324.1 hypothetical protein [Vibrio metschnikovii]MDA3140358.1 hypothetical protein [Vibrio metschnikovii]
MIYSLSSGLSLKTKGEVETELLRATKWMSEVLSIDYRNTRLGKYLRYLEGKEKLDSLADLQNYSWVAREIEDLLMIFQAFINDEQPTLKSKIEKVISGQEFRHYAAREENDASRDYLHELAVAARFKKSGLVVDISGLCDVVVRYKNKEIFVECKRIKSEKQLVKRFKNAEKQLVKRFGVSKRNKIGYIALDVTDLFDCQGELAEFTNVESLNNYFQIKLSEFVSKRKDTMRQYVGRETKSVLFFANGFGLVLDNMQSRVINTTVIHALGCESNPKDGKTNEKILRSIL